MKKNPCLGCDKRHIGCHSDCEKHIEWKADHLKANHERWLYEQSRAMSKSLSDWLRKESRRKK